MSTKFFHISLTNGGHSPEASLCSSGPRLLTLSGHLMVIVLTLFLDVTQNYKQDKLEIKNESFHPRITLLIETN